MKPIKTIFKQLEMASKAAPLESLKILTDDGYAEQLIRDQKRDEGEKTIQEVAEENYPIDSFFK